MRQLAGWDLRLAVNVPNRRVAHYPQAHPAI